MAGAADDGRESVEEVMSEVHLGCPPRFHGGYYVSRFTFSMTPIPKTTRNFVLGEHYYEEASTSELLPVDDDGDLLLTRRSSSVLEEASTARMLPADDDGDLLPTRQSKPLVDYEVVVQHKITSPLSTVGLQVWKGAMLLADFILHESSTSSNFSDIIALELGAGTGIAGFILAHLAKKVFLTDNDDKVLENCDANVRLNSNLFNYHNTIVHVKKFDWKKSWPPSSEAYETQTSSKYSWTSSEIEEAAGASLLLAADVIYSDELTDSFFRVLEILMSIKCEKVLYLTLEKRYNFSLNDLDVVANGYSHFRSYLKDEEGCYELNGRSQCFVGEQIDATEIPQYVKGYDRGKDLELWKITYSAA